MYKVFGGRVEVYVEAGTSIVAEMGYEGAAEGCLWSVC